MNPCFWLRSVERDAFDGSSTDSKLTVNSNNEDQRRDWERGGKPRIPSPPVLFDALSDDEIQMYETTDGLRLSGFQTTVSLSFTIVSDRRTRTRHTDRQHRVRPYVQVASIHWSSLLLRERSASFDV